MQMKESRVKRASSDNMKIMGREVRIVGLYPMRVPSRWTRERRILWTIVKAGVGTVGAWK